MSSWMCWMIETKYWDALHTVKSRNVNSPYLFSKGNLFHWSYCERFVYAYVHLLFFDHLHFNQNIISIFSLVTYAGHLSSFRPLKLCPCNLMLICLLLSVQRPHINFQSTTDAENKIPSLHHNAEEKVCLYYCFITTLFADIWTYVSLPCSCIQLHKRMSARWCLSASPTNHSKTDKQQQTPQCLEEIAAKFEIKSQVWN